MNIWLYIVIGVFAVIGIYTTVWSAIRGARLIFGIARDLSQTLKDATEVAKAYREDLSFLRQYAEASVPPRVDAGSEPPSILPKHHEQESVTMPKPYLGRFETRPVEEDAPPEPISSVDVTGDEVETESEQPAVSIAEQERHKQETREADAARVKELLKMGIPEKPEA